ncbi:hypothetical protein O6P43_026179 [Quillaja saponaria]|uniref:DUF3615 domain-containing protein n=1 Tax=Quillaja saponaria TaxID=32244 RepID=A0AAD7LAK8_QUISA|nr:hypothetical protein O6P43_026179 [Quillaja saponaria]
MPIQELERAFVNVQDVECAKAALAYYNEMKGMDFELDVALSSIPVERCPSIWFHCSFKAKLRSSACQPETFFAEMFDDGPYKIVTACVNFERDGDHSDTSGGELYCPFCAPQVRHPPSGFCLGIDKNISFLDFARTLKWGRTGVDESGNKVIKIWDVQNMEAAVAKFDWECAEMALEVFNRKQVLDYEPVAVMKTAAFVAYPCIKYALNFKAKLKNSGGSPEEILFFAQVILPTLSDRFVNACFIVNPNCKDFGGFYCTPAMNKQKYGLEDVAGRDEVGSLEAKRVKYSEEEGQDEGKVGEISISELVTASGSEDVVGRDEVGSSETKLVKYSEMLPVEDYGFSHECAATALSYINKNKLLHSDYELVKVKKGCMCVCPPRVWYHLNFLAKPIDAGSTEVFFAELCLDNMKNKAVSSCLLLVKLHHQDKDKSSSGARYQGPYSQGCGFCRREIIHPFHGLHAGRWAKSWAMKSPVQ